MRIAVCYPDAEWLDRSLENEVLDAAIIQQNYITCGLEQRHTLTHLAPYELHSIAYQTQAGKRNIAPHTWSGTHWYALLRNAVWKGQKLLGISYLNIFSNYSRYDALLQILPGHDVVYERIGIYNASIAMACRKLGLPYILFFDADQLLELDYLGEPIRGLLRWRAENISKYNLRVAKRIVCVSAAARQHLIETWHVPEEKIAVFPNGVDVHHFRPSRGKREETRASLALSDDHFVFLFVGNFYKWHDVPTLLDAFAQVLGENPQARLVLVGSGAQLPAMQAYAERLNITDATIFTGQIPHRQIPDLICAAEAAVAPVPEMDRELWLSPMKLYEYMASGAAIIASRVGQIVGVIEDHRNGLLVEPGDSQELAQAMSRLIWDPALANRLGRQARQDAVMKYSWEEHSLRLEELFNAVLPVESRSKRLDIEPQ